MQSWMIASKLLLVAGVSVTIASFLWSFTQRWFFYRDLQRTMSGRAVWAGRSKQHWAWPMGLQVIGGVLIVAALVVYLLDAPHFPSPPPGITKTNDKR
jgi:hypothetical protein